MQVKYIAKLIKNKLNYLFYLLLFINNKLFTNN